MRSVVLKLQLKTHDNVSTKESIRVGVALHKTHGDETRPNNLYKKSEPVFDFLVLLHPHYGILIVPYSKIPEYKIWKDYLADPVTFPWISEKQLPVNHSIESGLTFVIINIKDLPLHYLIGKGIKNLKKGYANEKWNNQEFNDIIYPNIKLKFEIVNNEILLYPAINSYKKFKGNEINS